MKILALDTSGDACSVALYDAAASAVLAEEHLPIERGHAEILFAQIARVTQAGATALKSVDRFAVTIGPGTFTGVRIGLAAARGLALAAQRPLIGIGSLEAVARGAEAPPGALIVAAFDARRGELYVQAFRGEAPITQPMATTPQDAANTLMRLEPNAPLFAIGSGAELLRATLGQQGARVEVASGEALPRASVLARIAARREPTNQPVMPLYLRAPDAKLPAVS